jgi:signal transduction histidine kinase
VAVVGWPVASGDLLRGLLVVSFSEGAAPEGEGLATARVACDQLALALERHALAEQVRRQHALMSQLEERAQAGEASFSELIAVVAHEIRTPLTSIKAYTETLIDAPATEFEARRSFLTVIDEECDRLARLVSDALDLSRLEAGHRALKLRTIAPSAFVADLLTTLGPEAMRQGVVLESDVDAALGAIEGDPDLLKQLMLNLVGNALKFSPQGGKVVLRAQGEGAEWRLEVEDAGVGIPEDQLDRVFERFYRVELKGGRRVPGTGLGLASRATSSTCTTASSRRRTRPSAARSSRCACRCASSRPSRCAPSRARSAGAATSSACSRPRLPWSATSWERKSSRCSWSIPTRATSRSPPRAGSRRR